MKPLPDDPAATIVEAVRGLTWPLGRRSLVALLRGSVKAPPSARRSPAFGALAAASDAQVTRWVRALEVAGALVEVEKDGFRVLEAPATAPLPSLAPPPATAAVRAARRRASRLAHEPRPRGRRPRVRRPARCDARRARGAAPALDG